MAARTRLQEGLETLVQDSDSVWAEQIRAEKVSKFGLQEADKGFGFT